MTSARRRAAGSVLALVLALAGVPAAARADGTGEGTAPAPVRILIVGDSVTHGSAGDWTWRYRLWERLRGTATPVDFVGPREDLFDNVAGNAGSLDYADPDFDRDHAARWGMQVDVLDVPIETLVADYRPDIVVEMLGVNDLTWGARPPATVGARVGRFVDDARGVDPEVDLVLAEATQHWKNGVPEFNALLGDQVAARDDADSRVLLARTADGYDAARDTWDGTHPNARGEVRIAAAVATALADLGVDVPPGPWPTPEVGPRTGADLVATAGDGQVSLDWTGPPGATASYVWTRDRTDGEPWRRLPGQVTGGSWTGSFANGHRHQFRLQPVKGDDEPEGGVYSNVVTVLPAPLLQAPTAFRVARRNQRVTVLRWQRVAAADHYVVTARQHGRWVVIGRTPSARLATRRLPVRRAWRVRVESRLVEAHGDVARIRVPRGRR
ncbi:GDSL-type esterase/lipase family protein [Nocardioides sp. GY 10113]|uniref:GDSL-type esterase/lipase family protein n=1 Tax=Nocardioides sp. GY 10113 TaxID=2569761 RepID=UPI001458EA3C|nr:GDSL-type esterase/lipase family protein [Nocardioides sp. GY 10113]